MSGERVRPKRVAELIKKELAQLVQFQLKDPRMKQSFVTITEVELTSDLRYATVYYSVLDENDADDVANAFESAAGFIRNHIGKTVKLRFVPQLQFKLDQSLQYGMRMQKIIAEANKDLSDAGQ